ncbi:MAG: phosphoglycolate phosphatase [Planctomycetota bacterium]
MIRPAFLFDLDGTLADTLPDLAASTNHVRAQHGLPPVELAVVRGFVGDGARTLVARALAEVLPAGAAGERQLDRAFEDYVTHHRVQCTVLSALYPGVREHLEQLHEQGVALGVVTNKPEQFARPLLRHLGLHDLLSVIVGGDTVPQRKPDPEPLRFALRELGLTAAAATMVGDGVQDLRAGKAAGLRTIGCLFGYGDPDALRREGADAFWSRFGTAE